MLHNLEVSAVCATWCGSNAACNLECVEQDTTLLELSNKLEIHCNAGCNGNEECTENCAAVTDCNVNCLNESDLTQCGENCKATCEAKCSNQIFLETKARITCDASCGADQMCISKCMCESACGVSSECSSECLSAIELGDEASFELVSNADSASNQDSEWHYEASPYVPPGFVPPKTKYAAKGGMVINRRRKFRKFKSGFEHRGGNRRDYRFNERSEFRM